MIEYDEIRDWFMLRMNEQNYILVHSKQNEVNSGDDFGLAFILGLENDA